MYGLQAEAHFDSAHFLTNYHGKCENLHGHRWRIVATITTENLADGLADNGTSRDMVLDFGAFKRLVAEIADELDHTFLVEEGSLAPSTIAALEAEGFSLTILPFRTTAENLARWIFERLVERSLPVSQVEVDETPNNRAFYSRSPEAAS
ncbi:6-pyruvoyl trahydropterin synthase family protein [Olsenella sp. Marseille-QA0557]|uniref:6-pyruvoyl trahydropterin synthase family protein n=1 Tax=Olsenella sp. Marseille-QA0557 TaxID=3378782 RepID=UPI003D0BD0BE